MGARDRADEFFDLAREHAGMLFDRGSYANAEALYCMAYLAFSRVLPPPPSSLWLLATLLYSTTTLARDSRS